MKTALSLDVLEQAASVLRVLSHPQRLKIVDLLQDKRMTVGELSESLGLAQNAVSQHLNSMKVHGILDRTRDGRRVYYSVVHPHAKTVLGCIRKHACGEE